MNFDQCKVELLKDTIKVLNISDDEYFSSDYSKYVSNSKLALINPKEGGSPEKYINGITQDYNPSFDSGTAVHNMVLQSDIFKLSDYKYKPSGKLGKFIDEIIKYRKQGYKLHDAFLKSSESTPYYKGKLSEKLIKQAIKKGLRYYLDVMYNDLLEDNLIILPDKMLYATTQCIKSVHDNLSIRRLLKHQNLLENKEFYNELAIILDCRVTLPDDKSIIIPLKLKIDNYTFDPETNEVVLNDLKTTIKGLSYFMGKFEFSEVLDKNIFIEGSFQKYHYFRQIGFYLWVLIHLYGADKKYSANILCVESDAPFDSDVFKINQEWIKLGIKEFKELIIRVAFHSIYGFNQEFKI